MGLVRQKFIASCLFFKGDAMDFSTGVWGCSPHAYSIPGIRMTLFASGGKHK